MISENSYNLSKVAWGWNLIIAISKKIIVKIIKVGYYLGYAQGTTWGCYNIFNISPSDFNVR